jgi:uncharacterized membrane protein
MPSVDTSVWINAPIQRVYAVAQDNLAFPSFMEDVKSIELVSREGNTIVTDWVGIVSAFQLKVKWRQEDIWNDEARRCDFNQLKGDYDEMHGYWLFTEENGGTQFVSHVEYIYNVPGVGVLVGKIIHSLVVKNLEGVLNAIKERAEASPQAVV